MNFKDINYSNYRHIYIICGGYSIYNINDNQSEYRKYINDNSIIIIVDPRLKKNYNYKINDRNILVIDLKTTLEIDLIDANFTTEHNIYNIVLHNRNNFSIHLFDSTDIDIGVIEISKNVNKDRFEGFYITHINRKKNYVDVISVNTFLLKLSQMFDLSIHRYVTYNVDHEKYDFKNRVNFVYNYQERQTIINSIINKNKSIMIRINT